MLSDEEKKAIEHLKDYLGDLDLAFNGIIKTETAKDYKIILNLIEKQQKEIEELKGIKFENERTIELFIEGYKRIYKGLDIKSLVMNENILINEIKENFTSNDKIKAKIEEIKDGTYDAKIVLQSLLEKE